VGYTWNNCTALDNDGDTEPITFEFTTGSATFGGTCPIVADSPIVGTKETPVEVEVNRPSGTDVTASPTVVTSTFTHPTATITGDSLYSSTTQSLDFSIPTITVIVPFITPYNAFFKNIANGGIDLDTNTIRVALVTSDYTFDRDAHEYFDDITNEITGTGYTAKGTELTGKISS